MGTYTTNYNMFLPSIGEQGWGELVNGNFTIIDTTMKSLSNRIGILEPLSIIQVDSNMNVTFPADVTVDGEYQGVFSTLNIDVRPIGIVKLVDWSWSRNSSDHGYNKTLVCELPDFKGGTLVPNGYYIKVTCNQTLNYTRTFIVTYNDITVEKTMGKGSGEIVPETYVTDLHNFSIYMSGTSGIGTVTLYVYAYI